jgi:hypothetical protein
VCAGEGEGGEGVWDRAAEAKRMAGAEAIGAGRTALQQGRRLLVAVAGGSRVVVGRRVGGGHQEGMAERQQVAGRRYQWMHLHGGWAAGARRAHEPDHPGRVPLRQPSERVAQAARWPIHTHL